MFKYKTPVRQLAHRWLKAYPERIQFLENIVSNLSERCREEVYHALADHDIWGGYPDASNYSSFAMAIATDLINYFAYCDGRLLEGYTALDAIGSPVFLSALQQENPAFYWQVADSGCIPYDCGMMHCKNQLPVLPKLSVPEYKPKTRKRR